MSKVIFLVGSVGSGKDLLLRSVLGSHELVEISLDKLYTAIADKSDLSEVNNLQNLIVNGNAERLSAVTHSKAVLEAMGYETSMVFVYTTNEASKARNDARIARGAKTYTEQARKAKYDESVTCLESYSKRFENFWLFNNSTPAGTMNEEVKGWLIELSEEIDKFLGETQTTKDYVRHMSGPRTPPQAPAAPHTSNIKGFERVKDGNRWVLRRKSTSESTKYNSLNQAFETYTATAVDNSRGNTRVTDNGSPTENPATVMAKVLKPTKKTPRDTQSGIARSDVNRAEMPAVESLSVDITHGGDPESKKRSAKKAKETAGKVKGANPPPDFFDSKMGGVPSGSLGLTSSYVPVGKSLSEIRKNLEPSKMEHHEAELRKKRIAAQLKGDVETAKRLEDEIDKLNPAAAARTKNIKKADRARKPNKTWGR